MLPPVIIDDFSFYQENIYNFSLEEKLQKISEKLIYTKIPLDKTSNSPRDIFWYKMVNLLSSYGLKASYKKETYKQINKCDHCNRFDLILNNSNMIIFEDPFSKDEFINGKYTKRQYKITYSNQGLNISDHYENC